MRLLPIISVAVAVLVGCKAAPETSSLAASAPPTEQKATVSTEALLKKIREAAPGDTLSRFNKDGSDKPNFPDGKVVPLNAIVKLSYDAIERYDKERKSIAKTVAAAKGSAPGSPAMQQANAAVAEVQKLHEVVRSSKTQLDAEGVKLLNGGKYYNIEIFSGMALFVDKVNKEFDEEIKALSATAK